MGSKRSIRRFLNRELLDGEVGSGDPLAEGRLDSLAIEQLVAFLEERFEIAFVDEELVAENFSSVDAVASLVDRKRGARD